MVRVTRPWRDHQAAFHATGERDDLAVLLVPERQRPEHLFYVRRIGRLPEKPAAEADRIPDRFEGVRRKLLGHESDEGNARAR